MRTDFGMFPCAITCRIIYIYIYIYIYMIALHKPVKERFSEGSEAVVLLSVVLSDLPVGIVLLE